MKAIHGRRSRTGARGFTLVEVLAATLILTLFLIFGFSTMSSMTTSARAGTAEVNAVSENQKALQAINLDLLQSTMDRVTVSPTTLTLEVVEGFDNLTGDALWSTPITYTRNAQDQVVRTRDGTGRVVANGVTALAFTSDVTDVTISVSTSSGNSANNTDSQATNSLTVHPKN